MSVLEVAREESQEAVLVRHMICSYNSDQKREEEAQHEVEKATVLWKKRKRRRGDGRSSKRERKRDGGESGRRPHVSGSCARHMSDGGGRVV